MEKVQPLGQRLRTLMEERQLNYEALGKLLEMREDLRSGVPAIRSL